MSKIIWVIAVLLIGNQSFSQAKKPGLILAATTLSGVTYLSLQQIFIGNFRMLLQNNDTVLTKT
jgi:hypothetical protein